MANKVIFGNTKVNVYSLMKLFLHKKGIMFKNILWFRRLCKDDEQNEASSLIICSW